MDGATDLMVEVSRLIQQRGVALKSQGQQGKRFLRIRGKHGLLDRIEDILEAHGVGAASLVTWPPVTTVAQAQDLRAQARAEHCRVICRKKAQNALVNGSGSVRKRHDERGEYFRGPAREASGGLDEVGLSFECIHGVRSTSRRDLAICGTFPVGR